ncbi:MAG: Hsp20/alpha crystallin family protein [Haloplanus sp.]
MSSRSNPFRDIERMFERMAEQFDDPASGWNETPFMPGTETSMRVDVVDRGDAFVVRADLPGVSAADIDVTLSETTLDVEVERESTETSEDSEDSSYLRRERVHESTSRSIRLPERVDEAAVDAAYDDGVLTVTLPKAGSTGGKRIEVE